jgi:diamine N-acetyltransferase
LAICLSNLQKSIGLIDLFDFDPKNNRCGIGILIQDDNHRNKGVGTEALQLLLDYAFYHLNLNQIFANIDTQNEPSLKLFTKFGFQKIGIKKQWNLVNGVYKDEVLLQKIKNQ